MCLTSIATPQVRWIFDIKWLKTDLKKTVKRCQEDTFWKWLRVATAFVNQITMMPMPSPASSKPLTHCAKKVRHQGDGDQWSSLKSEISGRLPVKEFTSMEFYMFGAGMLFLGVLLGVVGIAVYKSQVKFLGGQGWFLQTLNQEKSQNSLCTEQWFLPNTCSYYCTIACS